MTTRMVTAQDYQRAFETERANEYPVVDAFVERMDNRIAKWWVEDAARVLACPVKDNPPNWQHGYVLYALARRYMHQRQHDAMYFRCLDVGTAKGFSALCLQMALRGHNGVVTSVDVLNPADRVRRNTVAELDGYKTLAEILAPWPEAQNITFVKSTGQKWLQEHTERIHVAFIDGKHSYDVVSWEVALLAERQQRGDLAIFDDVQIAGVRQALKDVTAYDFEYLDVKPGRMYAIGTRK